MGGLELGVAESGLEVVMLERTVAALNEGPGRLCQLALASAVSHVSLAYGHLTVPAMH